jgi:hypothetical protein
VAVHGLVSTELARSAIGVRGSLDAVLTPRLERNEAVALAARGAFLQGEPRSQMCWHTSRCPACSLPWRRSPQPRGC